MLQDSYQLLVQPKEKLVISNFLGSVEEAAGAAAAMAAAPRVTKEVACMFVMLLKWCLEGRGRWFRVGLWVV